MCEVCKEPQLCTTDKGGGQGCGLSPYQYYIFINDITSCIDMIGTPSQVIHGLAITDTIICKRLTRAVFLNRRAAARYRALASIIPGRERPNETTICYKISLVQLITNLNVILYLSTCHTVYISVLIIFMIMP